MRSFSRARSPRNERRSCEARCRSSPRRAVSQMPFCTTSMSAARRLHSPRVSPGRAARINRGEAGSIALLGRGVDLLEVVMCLRQGPQLQPQREILGGEVLPGSNTAQRSSAAVPPAPASGRGLDQEEVLLLDAPQRGADEARLVAVVVANQAQRPPRPPSATARMLTPEMPCCDSSPGRPPVCAPAGPSPGRCSTSPSQRAASGRSLTNRDRGGRRASSSATDHVLHRQWAMSTKRE